MIKKNTLYTVNPYNKKLFPDGGQLSSYGGVANPYYNNQYVNRYGKLEGVADPLRGSVLSQTEGSLATDIRDGMNKETPKIDSGSSFDFGSMAMGAAGAIPQHEMKIGKNTAKNGIWDAADPTWYLANGRSSKAGDTVSGLGVNVTKAGLQSGNPWVALAGAALKVTGSFMNAIGGTKENTENTGMLKDNTAKIQAAGKALSQAGSNEEILGASGMMGSNLNFSNTDLFEGGWSRKAKRRARNKAQHLLRQQDAALAAQNQSLANSVNNVNTMNNDALMSNFAAFGGSLDTGEFNPYGNPYAFGGTVSTHGGDFSTGLSHVNAGGTHEENPNQGVQYGTDSEGTPNLVEEGETVWNDFVFSNRIEVDDQTKKRFHISPRKKITYAELSKKLEKEMHERPNDPISKHTLNVQMQSLSENQERQKQEAEERRMQEIWNSMSPEEKAALIQQQQMQDEQQTVAEQQAAQQQQMAQMSPEDQAAMEQQQPNMFGSGGPFDEAPDNIKEMVINSFKDIDPVLWERIKDDSEKIKTYLNPFYQDWLNNPPKEVAPLDNRDPMYMSVDETIGYLNREKNDVNELFNYLANKSKEPKELSGIAKKQRLNNEMQTYVNRFAQEIAEQQSKKDIEDFEREHPYATANARAGREAYIKVKRATKYREAIMDQIDVTSLANNHSREKIENTANLLYNLGVPKEKVIEFCRIKSGNSIKERDKGGAQINLDSDRWFNDLESRLGSKQPDASSIYKTIGIVASSMPAVTPASKSTATAAQPDNVLSASELNAVLPEGAIPPGGSAAAVTGGNGRVSMSVSGTVRPHNGGTPAAVTSPRNDALIGEGLLKDSQNTTRKAKERPAQQMTEKEKAAREYLDKINSGGESEEEKWRRAYLAVRNAVPFEHSKESYMRYAPVFGNMWGVIQNVASNPDYSRADEIKRTADTTPKFIQPKVLGNYMTFNPVDIWAEQNRLDADARATERALLNNNNPNRAAGIIATGYNSMQAQGDLFRKVLEYNDAKRNQVASFNRATDQYNSQAGLTAQAENQKALQTADALRYQGVVNGNTLMNTIDAQRNAALNANTQGLIRSVGNLGEEAYDMDRLKWLEQVGILRSNFFDKDKYNK